MTVRLNHWIGAGQDAPSTITPDAATTPGFETDPPVDQLDAGDATAAAALAQAAATIAASYSVTTVSIDAKADTDGSFIRVTFVAALAPPPDDGTNGSTENAIDSQIDSTPDPAQDPAQTGAGPGTPDNPIVAAIDPAPPAPAPTDPTPGG